MSANQYLRRAVELAQGGDNKSALVEVKRALEIEPDHPKGLIFRFTLEARLLRRAQRPGDAAVRYRAVLALDPNNAEAKKMLREHTEGAPTAAATPPQAAPAAKPAAPASDAAPPVAKAAPQAAKAAPQAAKAPPQAAKAPPQAAKAPPQAAKAAAPAPRASAPSEQRVSRNMTSDMPTGHPPALHQAPPAAPVMSQRVARNAPPPAASEPPAVEVTAFERSRAPSAATSHGQAARRLEPAVSVAPADGVEMDPYPEELPPPSVETPLEPERRIAPRVAIEVDVGISSESNFFTGFSGDISEGGLFIATYNVIPIGSDVEVSFGVLGHEIKAHATVCWIRDPIDINLMPGFGVRFGDLSDEDHAVISHFIHARAPMFFDDE